MSETPASPNAASPGEALPPPSPIETTRMSFGDHLEELRRCLIHALVGIAIAAGAALYFGDRIMEIVLRPLFVIQRLHGQRAEVTALSPPESFTVYIKLALLCGLILSMPWVLYQLWKFVSAGLYIHEQRFVRLLVPTSTALFALGIAFFYWVVLPIVLDFFVAFSPQINLPDLQPTGLERFLLSAPAGTPDSQAAGPDLLLPLYSSDPPNPQPGAAWINTTTRELRVMAPEGPLFAPLTSARKAAVSGQFALQFYVSFVLSLALAFGLAFEMPVIVVFLSLMKLVPAESMSRARRYIVFGIIVAAAVLTPPDVLSMVLLSIPMIALFEGGLLAARLLERRKA